MKLYYLTFICSVPDPNNEGNVQVQQPAMPEAQITTSRLRNVDVIGSCNFELSELRALPLPPPLAFIVSMTEGCPIWNTGNTVGAITTQFGVGKVLGSKFKRVFDVPF